MKSIKLSSIFFVYMPVEIYKLGLAVGGFINHWKSVDMTNDYHGQDYNSKFE